MRQAAWVLATCPEAAVRNGSEAVALAVRAIQLPDGKDAGALDTLAAAYAETGRFAEAVSTARRALALVKPAEAEAIKSRIALYEEGKPFRETRRPASLGR
jgi:Flp pilus assembly protein TadD